MGESTVKSLTTRQQLVLSLITRSLTETGKAPSLRTIGAELGIRSVRGVQKHVDALVDKGALVRERYKPSGLSLPSH